MDLTYSSNVLHTARHLKLKQIFYQIYYRVKKVSVEECDSADRRTWMASWNGHCYLKPCTSNAHKFSFLGQEGSLSNGWNNDNFSKLWLYNLHYLDNLNAVDCESLANTNELLVNKWVDDNPGVTGVGWEPYPISLRLVNVVKWASRENVHSRKILCSLVTQARALTQQIEYNILGNHLLANGKGLVFCGAFLLGSEADEFLDRGLKILDSELPEQFLNDGAHFELSPMYHSIMLWDLCDLIHLAYISQLEKLMGRVSVWQSILEKGIIWLRSMIHPDGEIGFFNDSSFGIAPRLECIEDYAAQLSCLPLLENSNFSLKFWNLYNNKQSGYITIDSGEGDHRAILDVGRIGPTYQPGHAHADTLSFELSLFARRVIVNSGTSRYGNDDERLRQRSTSAHNTVEVDGISSSEVWSGFRVARRANPVEVVISSGDDVNGVVVCASHDGYHRLQGDVTHTRRWQFKENSIRLMDVLSGTFDVALSRLYFHPQVDVKKVDDGRVELALANGHSLQILIGGHKRISVEKTTWHSEFGSSLSNFCVVTEFHERELSTLISWS